MLLLLAAPAVSIDRLRFARREIALRCEPCRSRGRLRVFPATVIRGIGPRVVPTRRITLGLRRRGHSLRAISGFAPRRRVHSRLSIDTAAATLPPDWWLLERRERVVSPRPMSRVISDRSKTAPQPSRAASAMSTRTAFGNPPMMTSRLTGARQTPTDAGDRQRSGGGAVFPRGEREQDTTRSRRLSVV